MRADVTISRASAPSSSSSSRKYSRETISGNVNDGHAKTPTKGHRRHEPHPAITSRPPPSPSFRVAIVFPRSLTLVPTPYHSTVFIHTNPSVHRAVQHFVHPSIDSSLILILTTRPQAGRYSIIHTNPSVYRGPQNHTHTHIRIYDPSSSTSYVVQSCRRRPSLESAVQVLPRSNTTFIIINLYCARTALLNKNRYCERERRPRPINSNTC